MYIISQRLLAKEYNVSRRLICFIAYPDKLKAMQEKHRKEQHWKTYYNRKQLTECTRKWRAKLNADDQTKNIYKEYKKVMSKRSRDKIGARECPQCGKVLKALRDHVRRQHESVV